MCVCASVCLSLSVSLCVSVCVYVVCVWLACVCVPYLLDLAPLRSLPQVKVSPTGEVTLNTDGKRTEELLKVFNDSLVRHLLYLRGAAAGPGRGATILLPSFDGLMVCDGLGRAFSHKPAAFNITAANMQPLTCTRRCHRSTRSV